jgi:hypothetical protein
MKVISKSEGELSIIENYDLDEAFSEKDNNKGLVICYLLAYYEREKFISLELVAKFREVGVSPEYHKLYESTEFLKCFPEISSFLDSFDNDEFGEWKLVMKYQNTEVAFDGTREDTNVRVMYPKETKVNVLPVLGSIETVSYENNNYDPYIIRKLTDDGKMSTKRAVLAVQKLQTHQDIYHEYVSVVKNDGAVSSDKQIHVEGYTAQQLSQNYPLSLLGAYNYLIYLRESPKEALADLKNGLPRR